MPGILVKKIERVERTKERAVGLRTDYVGKP
jgi:hypothetical protein